MTALNDRTILVIGATGKQGGASARHLLEEGWPVRALVRDASTPAAQAIAARGAQLVQGDLDDLGSIERALEGVYGVHNVQAYLPKDPEREVRQGSTVVDAARAAGVQHFVYSSAAAADRHIGIPETESKWKIEEHLRASGLNATILRPTYFMDNLTFMRTWVLGSGVLSMPLLADTRLQMIASDDIGAFVAVALDNPTGFVGRAVELAGDAVTMDEMAETFSRVTGREIHFSEMPMENARGFDPNLATMCEWLKTHDFGANVGDLRKIRPDMLTLEAWLMSTGWDRAAKEALVS